MDFSQILTFFSSLFQKQEFFARFLERRFFATHSLIELGIAAVVIFIAYEYRYAVLTVAKIVAFYLYHIVYVILFYKVFHNVFLFK